MKMFLSLSPSSVKVVALTCLVVFACVPLVASAQFTAGGTGVLGSFGLDLLNFIEDILIPFLLAVALALFIYGAFVYLILSGGDEESREAGRRYMLWGIIAFVVIVSIWGITELIASGLGFDTRQDIDDLIPNDDIRNPG